MKNAKIQKTRKSNRLRFKKQKPRAKVTSNPTVRRSIPSDEEYHDEEIPISTPPVNKFREKKTSPVVEEVVEWGPSINGYRFIGTPESSKHFEKRNTIINESKSSYNWSYMEIPSFKQRDDDPLEAKYSRSSSIGDDCGIDVMDYDRYIQEWQRIKTEGLGEVIFPLPQSQLNVESVRKFFKRGPSDYEKALKSERIRWHPDKMIRTLRLDPHDDGYENMVGRITKMFQIVNELWEEIH